MYVNTFISPQGRVWIGDADEDLIVADLVSKLQHSDYEILAVALRDTVGSWHHIVICDAEHPALLRQLDAIGQAVAGDERAEEEKYCALTKSRAREIPKLEPQNVPDLHRSPHPHLPEAVQVGLGGGDDVLENDSVILDEDEIDALALEIEDYDE